MKLETRDFGNLFRVARESGIAHASNLALLALRARLMSSRDERWESQFGVRIRDSVPAGFGTISSENKKFAFSYRPTPGQALRVLIGSVRHDLRDFTFVDLGSGEGRGLLVASSFPFREVLGVEFVQQLHEAAVINVDKFMRRNKGECRIRSLHMDAAVFEIPRQNCVLYLHNPFGEPVFEQVLKNIGLARQACDMKVFLLFQRMRGNLETAKATNVELVRESPNFVERRIRFRGMWDRFLLGSHELRIFESTPGADSHAAAGRSCTRRDDDAFPHAYRG